MALAPCEARTWRPFILGACCHAPHATYPNGEPETALEGFPSHRPYSVLLPVGFTVPLLLPVARWALTPPFHPCRGTRRPCGRRMAVAVCFLWHFPWGRPRRPLTGTVSPWSPDFPHPQPFDFAGAAAQPAGKAYKEVQAPKRKRKSRRSTPALVCRAIRARPSAP
jgi:hypothetical protein